MASLEKFIPKMFHSQMLNKTNSLIFPDKKQENPNFGGEKKVKNWKARLTTKPYFSIIDICEYMIKFQNVSSESRVHLLLVGIRFANAFAIVSCPSLFHLESTGTMLESATPSL